MIGILTGLLPMLCFLLGSANKKESPTYYIATTSAILLLIILKFFTNNVDQRSLSVGCVISIIAIAALLFTAYPSLLEV